jgi:hypothetical protein
MFACQQLGCILSRRQCVTRQAVSEVQITSQKSRGVAPDYPHCVTEHCGQGRKLRDMLDPGRMVGRFLRLSGPGRRWVNGRRDIAQQRSARQHLLAVGMLEEMPTIDDPPHDEEAEG